MRLRAAACIYTSLLACAVLAQTDWPSYGHDPGGMRYSPLKQITPSNVSQLHRAWTYHTGDTGNTFETTPIVVGGRMYLSTQKGRIVALQAETGKEIWSFDPHSAKTAQHRGVAYWPGDSQSPARILFGTADGRLMALDAKTGRPCATFGDNGIVNLRIGAADEFPDATYAITSPPALYKNLAIVGPNTQEGPSRGPSGDPRAFDVRSGKLVWRFHTIPVPGEPGADTWGPGGGRLHSGPSLWGLMNVDVERGIVVLATGNPADSFYGGDRKGTNLYANCVLALNAATGKLMWHYQVVHHDIWDYDLPGAPALIGAVENGRRVPAVAQITKMGLLFILDRMTGKPVFGAKEMPVPPSDVPGEEAWPTQPFPLKPPPLARISIRRDELTTRTPEAARFCAEAFDAMRSGNVFTPFGMKKTLVFPGTMGGGNWGGVSFDPTLSYAFVNTTSLGGIGQMAPTPAGSPMPYRNVAGYGRFVDGERYPCQQPPWGELSAVDTTTGDLAWRVPLGNYDELASQGLTHTGTPNVGGSIATAGGLVFIAATNDARLRAFESRTGRELWAANLDAAGNASPVTYMGADGHQYVVIAAGGPGLLRNVGDNSVNTADSVIAFALSGREPEATSLASRMPKRVHSAPASAELPEAEGKAVVQRVCGTCHGVETFAQSRMTRQQWQTVVSDMVSRGAKGSEEELRAVMDYLSNHLGK